MLFPPIFLEIILDNQNDIRYYRTVKASVRGNLETISVSLYPDQLSRLKFLGSVTKKTRKVLIREAVDAYTGYDTNRLREVERAARRAALQEEALANEV